MEQARTDIELAIEPITSALQLCRCVLVTSEVFPFRFDFQGATTDICVVYPICVELKLVVPEATASMDRRPLLTIHCTISIELI
jgi:hypothetical protein